MEWARAKDWEREDFVLAIYMGQVFEEARADECKVHDSACRSEATKPSSKARLVTIIRAFDKASIPFRNYEYHNRFRLVDTDAQEQLLDMDSRWVQNSTVSGNNGRPRSRHIYEL